MKKLLMSTALMTVLFSGAALSAAHEKSGIKIGGTLETTINTLSTKTATTPDNSTPKSIGHEAVLKISNTQTLSNGLNMSAGFALDSSDAFASDQFVTLSSGNTSFSIGNDVLGVIDAVQTSNFTPHVAQPFRLSGIHPVGNIVGTLISSHGDNGFYLQQKSDMLTFQGVYSPSNSTNDTGASGVAASGSGYDLAVKGNLGVPGLLVGYGISERNANNASGKKAESTAGGISYSVAGFTVGYGRADNTVAVTGVEIDNSTFGISYQVSKQLSVSAALGKSDVSDQARDTDYQTLQAGYDFGGMGITFGYYQAEDVGGASGADRELFEIRTISKF